MGSTFSQLLEQLGNAEIYGWVIGVLITFASIVVISLFYKVFNIKVHKREPLTQIVHTNGKITKEKPGLSVNIEHCTNLMIGQGNTMVQGSSPASPSVGSPVFPQDGNPEQTGLMKKLVRTWMEEDKTVFKTKGMNNVLKRAKNNSLVIVIGCQGCGKSKTIQHTAVQLINDGFVVYPVCRLSEIIEKWNEDRKQVFVMDDPLGKHCVSLSHLQKWEKYDHLIKTCISHNNTKILLAVRTEIINDQYVLTSETIFNLKDNILDLCDSNNALSENERHDMFLHFSSNGLKKKMPLTMPDLHCFPLLCHTFWKDNKIRKHPEKFFKSPFIVLPQRFNQMKNHTPYHFCALALCAVFDNKLTKRDFQEGSQHQLKIDEVLKQLGHTSSPNDIKRICDSLDALNGVYLKKTDKAYEFLHSLFQDIVIYLLGRESTRFLFKYSSSSLLRSRVRVSAVCDDEENIIILQRNDFKPFAIRMCEDLQKGNVADVFYHSALETSEFRGVFIKILKEKKIVEWANKENFPLLAWSCRVELFRLTIALIKEKADPNICDDEIRRSALMWACKNTRRTTEEARNVVRVLLRSGARVGLKDKRNKTALHFAIRRGDDQIVQEILKHDYEMDEHVKSGKHLAHAVRLAKTKQDHKKGDKTTCQHNERAFTGITDSLLRHGSDTNYRKEADRTILYHSVVNSNIIVTRRLLEHGADVSICNVLKEDLLCCAIANDHRSMIELLLEKNACVNTINKNAQSPLHLAVISRNTDLVRSLIAKGADVNLVDGRGKTALELSKARRTNDITQLIHDTYN